MGRVSLYEVTSRAYTAGLSRQEYCLRQQKSYS